MFSHKNIIAIHQPQYIPSLPYFHKIYSSNKFVILDDVQQTKKSFVKRTLIKKDITNSQTYLTIPTKKHSDYSLIKDIYANDITDWRVDHLRKIKAAYSKTKNYIKYIPLLESFFLESKNFKSIVDINVFFLKKILDLLELRRDFYFSSKVLNKNTNLNAHNRNLEICLKLNGNIYFSGEGAKKYQKDKIFPNNIKMVYQDIWSYLDKNPYTNKDKFINGLSILDAIFLIGPSRILEIFKIHNDNKNYFNSL
jgi:hypothetical protein